MTIYFVDSSALVKRYVAEKGSAWFHSLSTLPSDTTLVVSRITWVEVSSSLARLAREGKLTSDDLAAVLGFLSSVIGTISTRLLSLMKA